MRINALAAALTTVASLGALILNGCTNPTSTAGTVSSYYDGTLTGIEMIDIDAQEYDSTTNALLGAIGGAIIGNLLNKHSTGTLVGAGLGGAAAGLGSSAANRQDGLRLSVNTEAGNMIVDVPFSCQYRVGQKVRVISGGGAAPVQVYSQGAYRTATVQSKSECPTRYSAYKQGQQLND